MKFISHISQIIQKFRFISTPVTQSTTAFPNAKHMILIDLW